MEREMGVKVPFMLENPCFYSAYDSTYPKINE